MGSDGPGGLYAGAVTGHPLALAALCVLRVDFPDFYNQLQKRPELISEFNSIVFGTESSHEMAVGAQEALREFLVVGGEGSITREIRREHRELRRYLSSLQGLRWPDRLQPLLLLAQDAISRRYGDSAAALYDAFVSGDTAGVLEVFGRQLDEKPLSESDVRLLADLSEEVSHETEVRRINAARVLANLVGRVPAEYARGLMSPLARQLVALKAVRTNVGPRAAQQIIQFTTAIDQREVASRFIADLLTSAEIAWSLPTGESPNLDELVQIVHETVDLGLAVRRDHGLAENADDDLKVWLLTREVRYGKESSSMPFSELEQWIATHEEHLLPALGAGYSDLAIAEFETEGEAALDASNTIRRIEEQFRRLSEDGEESRGQLWEQLVRFVAVRSPDGFDAARKAVATYAALASEEQACGVLAAIASRLNKESEESENWALDWENGAKTFLELMSRWSGYVDTQAAELTGTLVCAWSDLEETADFGRRGFNLLETIGGNACVAVLDHLIAMPFGALSWPCRELVATRVNNLSAEQKTALVEQMDAVITTDDPNEPACSDYVRFVENAPENAWAGKPLDQHLERLLARLEAMFQDQNQFLTKLFPAGRALMDAAPNGRAATFLKQLFEQSAGVPNGYVVIHRAMVGAWPPESEAIGIYGATQIVGRATEFIEQNPSVSGIEWVLDSIVDLLSREIAAASVQTTVAKAAVIAWPNAAEAVVRNAGKLGSMMSPANVRDLLTGTQPEDKGIEVEPVLRSVRAAQDREQSVNTALEILSADPVTMNAQPDGALSAWLDVLGKELVPVVESLLSSGDLNDVQKERVHRRALDRKDALGLEFFGAAIPRAIEDGSNPRLRAAAVESTSEIAELATSAPTKSELVGQLVPSLPSVSGEELASLVRVIRELGGKGALERASETVGKIDDENLEIIVREFPESGALKKILKARHDESAGS